MRSRSTVSKICPICKKEFSGPRWRLRRQTYCSVKCAHEALKGKAYKEVVCQFCGKKFKVETWMERKYCSQECAWRALRGPRKREERKCLYCGSSFWVIPAKNKKFCSRECWRNYCFEKTKAKGTKRINGKQVNGKYVHRVIMEQMIGRPLNPRERVHHIDMDRFNNDPSNLYLYPNESEHQKGHRSFEKLAKELLKRGIITFKKGVYEINEEMRYAQ